MSLMYLFESCVACNLWLPTCYSLCLYQAISVCWEMLLGELVCSFRFVKSS